MAANSSLTDKKASMRNKRAQGIAAMGLVTREGDKFRVFAPTLRGRKGSYDVWRDESGKVRCSCPEFEEQTEKDTTFRCEHVLAVKHSLLLKSPEAISRQQPAAAASSIEQPAAVLLNTDANATEKSTTRKSARAVSSREHFERERDGTVESQDDAAPTVLPLAKPQNIEEQDMSKKYDDYTATPNPEADSLFEGELASDQVAPVVPMAFTNTLRALRQQVDQGQIRTREGWTDRQGNTHMVEYLEWHTVADILDHVTPTWSHAVRSCQQIGDMVAVVAAITIDGVTREGLGTGTADSEMGIKKAEHDALKRAAVKFGIARELYQRESEVIERQGAAPATGQFPRDPLAKSMADLITPKQLGMIRALAREAGVDADEESMNVLHCKTEELSKRAASSFIDHLKNLQQEAAGGMRRAS
jgi:hypothetical protein